MPGSSIKMYDSKKQFEKVLSRIHSNEEGFTDTDEFYYFDFDIAGTVYCNEV